MPVGSAAPVRRRGTDGFARARRIANAVLVPRQAGPSEIRAAFVLRRAALAHAEELRRQGWRGARHVYAGGRSTDTARIERTNRASRARQAFVQRLLIGAHVARWWNRAARRGVLFAAGRLRPFTFSENRRLRLSDDQYRVAGADVRRMPSCQVCRGHTPGVVPPQPSTMATVATPGFDHIGCRFRRRERIDTVWRSGSHKQPPPGPLPRRSRPFGQARHVADGRRH